MGTIHRSFDTSINVTVFTVKDKVVSAQIREQIITFLNGEPTKYVIWDFREGTMSGTNSKELRKIVEDTTPLTIKRAGGRTAIVCVKDVDFGFSRMFQIFTEIYEVPFEISVFRNLEDARKWLKNSEKMWERYIR